MPLIISKDIAAKIARDDHDNVTEQEVYECFANHCGRYCYEVNPAHFDEHGNPTPWFVAETNKKGRILKIMFVRDGANIYLKSAYPASAQVQSIFNRKAK
jgi:hypothetical protein